MFQQFGGQKKKMLQSLHDNPSVIRAIEQNTADFLLALGRAGGGVEHCSTELHWIIGGSPIAYHNCVISSALSPEKVDSSIEEVVEQFKLKNLTGSWRVLTPSQPPDLAGRLLAYGFTNGGTDVGMAINLHQINEKLPLSGDIIFKPVKDEFNLAEWEDTLGRGFGEGEIEAEWVSRMYRRIGYDEHSAWRHFLAYLDGKAVATASLFFSAGVAGIYFVFTVPHARRRSIGAGITLAALHTSRQQGYHIAVLGSSPMGYSVYRTLGFKEFCRTEIYEYHPK
jgi:GNAT superfamily N-acetyltransferase